MLREVIVVEVQTLDWIVVFLFLVSLQILLTLPLFLFVWPVDHSVVIFSSSEKRELT